MFFLGNLINKNMFPALIMTLFDGLLIFFSILFAYFILVFILHKKGILEKYKISLYGPGLLIRTKKGVNFLKKISGKKRFWKAYGSFGIVFCFIVMIVMIFFFVWQFILYMGLDLTPAQKAELPGPEFALVLPGINPILPMETFFYVIFALIVAIIVHEFSHGILTFASDLKVKSMGLLYLIIPIGAFVEPDEDQLKKTKISKRMRVFAAGPLANFVMVLITFCLFSFVFMASLQPVADGVVIVSTSDDSPADRHAFQQGMIITSINETPVSTYEDFFYVMNTTNAGQEVEIEYYWHGNFTKKINLSDKYEEYQKRYPEINNISYMGKGYIGIRPESQNLYLQVLQNPFGYNAPLRFFILITLPVIGYFEGYNPIVSPFTESYEITGPLGALPPEIFWGIVNALYWIFWLNLMVGLFNVIPMVPLDGGFLFADYIRAIVKKIKKEISEEKLDKIVKNVTLVVSLIILFLVIFPMLFKYI
jgi:membrane-associated protease RseP (regulator of RpoE activity)